MATFLPRSRVNGPGLRAVLWVQGCTRRCSGCCNPDFSDPSGGEEIGVPELFARIAATENLSGLTLSGGEPFEQAAPLADLCHQVHGLGLTVACFSGYELAELQEAPHPDRLALLGEVDLLVAGPYEQDRPCNAPLRSSANQTLHFLTGRIRPEHLQGLPRAEVTIQGGDIRVSGFEPGLADNLRSRLQSPSRRPRR